MLKGIGMGAADVVPGVSGGTMAFIFGIYEELIRALHSFDLTFFKHLLLFRWREAFSRVSWRFLLALGAGILTAVITLAHTLEWLLDNEPVLLWSFFFGLVLASAIVISRHLKKRNAAAAVSWIVGTVGAYVIVGLVPAEMSHAPWIIFLSGVVAICAMILPGISGSFILVLLGQYQYILSAVNQRDFLTLACFTAGCAVGILSFVRVVGWLFKRYYNATIALLTGFLVGSLRKIWPWKETISIGFDRHGKIIPTEQINIFPGMWSGEVGAAVGLMIFGMVVVILLDKQAKAE